MKDKLSYDQLLGGSSHACLNGRASFYSCFVKKQDSPAKEDNQKDCGLHWQEPHSAAAATLINIQESP